jgi:hypothetical protein
MKKFHFVAIAIVAFACSIGCLEAPPSIIAASKERSAATRAYAGAMQEVIGTVIAAYRKAELDKIEMAVATDIKANAGKFDAEGIALLIQKRDEKVAAIDDICRQLRAAVDRAETNLLIEAKLADAMEKYESAGIDMSSAKTAIDEILKLVTTEGVK